MKSILFAFAMMVLSSQVFAANSLFSGSKCYDGKGKFQEKIVGRTVCHSGHASQIPAKYNENEMIQIFDKNGNPTGEYQYAEVYCFNNNYTGLGCSKYHKSSTGSIKTVPVAAPKGVTVDGTWYPACSSAAVDADGDSWGWENNKSCKVI